MPLGKLSHIEFLTNDSLPESVRTILPDGQTTTLFRAALNSHLRDGKNEPLAYLKAYRFLEESGYERKEGKFIYKETLAVGDVHTDAPIGTKGKTPKQPKTEGLIEIDDAGAREVKAEKAQTIELLHPPNLHTAATVEHRCGTCGYFEDGLCRMYGGFPVRGDQVCDSYAPGAPGSLGEPVEKFVAPVEVQNAAKSAHGAGDGIVDITLPLSGAGLAEYAVREVAKHWSDAPGESAMIRNAWGGPMAAKWAARVLKKLEKHRAEVAELGPPPAEAVEKAGNGVMIAFWPDAEVTKRLALPGGEKSEDLHLTLAYLGKAVDESKLPALEEALRTFAVDCEPVSGTIAGPGRFGATEHSDGKDVCYATFDSPAIQILRQRLVEAIESCGLEAAKNFGYTPHITLAYVEPGAEMPVLQIDPFETRFEKLVLSVGQEKTEFPLTGKPKDKEHTPVEIVGNITKLDQDRQMIFGWFSICEVEGRPVVDTQSDVLTIQTLETAAYQFVLTQPISTEMHRRDADNKPVGIGRLCESCVFSTEKQQAILQSLQQQNIPAVLDLKSQGWWGGFKIDSPEVWSKVKLGTLRAFSIAGKGKREKVAE